MPIYDYECNLCGNVFEVITDPDDTMLRCCGHCGMGKARRIISARGVYTGNQDAPWLKDVLEVVNKGPDNTAADREFLKNPTRTNWTLWQESHRLIPYEPGMEKRAKPERDPRKITDQLMRRLQERRRIVIGG
jgi:putative FmdB family regulatory protein